MVASGFIKMTNKEISNCNENAITLKHGNRKKLGLDLFKVKTTL